MSCGCRRVERDLLTGMHTYMVTVTYSRAYCRRLEIFTSKCTGRSRIQGYVQHARFYVPCRVPHAVRLASPTDRMNRPSTQRLSFPLITERAQSVEAEAEANLIEVAFCCCFCSRCIRLGFRDPTSFRSWFVPLVNAAAASPVPAASFYWQ